MARWVYWLALTVISASHTNAQPPETAASARAKAAEGWEDFLGYSRKLEGTCQQRLISGSNETMLEEEFLMRRAGDGFIFSMDVRASKIANIFEPFVFGKNTQYVFTLRKAKDAVAWALTEVEPIAALRTRKDLDRTDWIEKLLCRHYFVEKSPLPVFLSQKDLRIGRLENKGDCVIIEFSNDKAKGWINVVATQKWHVREYQIITLSGRVAGTTRVANDVKSNNEGFPILVKRVEEFIGSEGKGDTWVEDFSLKEHSGLSDEDFSLTAFGFPEPDFSTIQRRRNWLWILLVCLGLALVLLGRTIRSSRSKTIQTTG